MPFVPHTESDVQEMLAAIGAERIDDLFDEIPRSLRERAGLEELPTGLSEQAMLQHLAARARQDEGIVCFAGAGAYDHYIPAAVWDLVGRGEFMTAYTPYQAEASQGTLQLIYEYQTMMAGLTGMDVSNASVYDGGSGLAEAVLMAVRANRKVREPNVLLAGTLNPRYRQATHTIVHNQGIRLIDAAMDPDTGLCSPPEALDAPVAAVVLQYPNFFGGLEDVDAWTDWAHAHDALVIAVCNPTALALLKPPGDWGSNGADIAVGDGQPLGIPMSSGGPYFGYLCARQGLVRQLPGRIIGRTVDMEGRDGYALTLQAREQHIRRAKATSNICTNQGLLVTAGTIYMALMGASGLRQVALASHRNTLALRDALTAIDGVTPLFPGPLFHETALRLPVPAAPVIERIAQQGMLAGVCPGAWFPGMDDVLLCCATEQRTPAEIDRLATLVADAIAAPSGQAA